MEQRPVLRLLGAPPLFDVERSAGQRYVGDVCDHLHTALTVLLHVDARIAAPQLRNQCSKRLLTASDVGQLRAWSHPFAKRSLEKGFKVVYDEVIAPGDACPVSCPPWQRAFPGHWRDRRLRGASAHRFMPILGRQERGWREAGR